MKIDQEIGSVLAGLLLGQAVLPFLRLLSSTIKNWTSIPTNQHVIKTLPADWWYQSQYSILTEPLILRLGAPLQHNQGTIRLDMAMLLIYGDMDYTLPECYTIVTPKAKRVFRCEFKNSRNTRLYNGTEEKT